MNLLKFRIILFFSFLFFLSFPLPVLAQTNSFVSIVNPVRGEDFWDLKDQKPQTAVLGQMDILKRFNASATWLIRFDALSNKTITSALKGSQSEKGLFLEITPTWAKAAGVKYHSGENWHAAGSAFLTGYEREEREKLIDSVFSRFKEVFGFYPTSVGAWWIDSYSLDYMQKKYAVSAALIVADQYSTDNYQIWGQYFSTPYYPSKKNALHPAQTLENKLPMVITQWATRDPVNGYGNGVIESTYSLQANDYIDYHNLDIKYFSKLIDIYTKQPLNQLSQLVVGLENSYSWQKYSKEYENQVETLVSKRKSSQISLATMRDFASWYKSKFPDLSPQHLIVADDPLGTYEQSSSTNKKVVWFMNPYYRAGWFLNQDGSVFRDIRQYIDGSEELCFKARCDSVNFATSATRVLDEVSFGHKWVIDDGRITDFNVVKQGENYEITYKNEAGHSRTIEFLPRDIGIDGKISSIDGAILDATKKEVQKKINSPMEEGTFAWSLNNVLFKTIAFILFLTIGCIIPGFLLINRLLKNKSVYQTFFLSTIVGLVELTLIFYILGLFKIRFLIYPYILINLILFLGLYLPKLKKINIPKIKNRVDLAIITLIIMGTAFQVIPAFKNGLVYPFGLGFWGPNTHDGVWHISLINQLIKAVPPENPIFSGNILKNYHFFYDLLVAATNYLVKIPVLDLVFRFYPILFSLSLGIGTYYLVRDLFEESLGILKTKIASLFSLYLVYFAGSFGWIVSFIKERNFAGESAFWANQSISFNLNPPFAISLLIIIALIQVLIFSGRKKRKLSLAILLAGGLIGFKAYGAVLVLVSLVLIGLFKKRADYLIVFIGALIITVVIFFANFQPTSALMIFAPFWFIHSMIDSPDRVGWMRLTLARTVGLEKGIWWKFITAEFISLILFIAGNLGLRMLSLLSLIKIKRIVKDSNLLFLLVFSTLSFLIPILFIQSGNPWNTIQFFYYGLYVTAVISGVVLLSLIVNLPKFLLSFIIGLFLIISPINSLVTASYYTNYLPHARVDKKELEALEFLSKQQDGVVLTYPYDDKLKKRIEEPWPLFVYDSTSYVSALSNKAVYLVDESQNQILLTDYKKRIVASKDFFSDVIPHLSTDESLQTAKNFLRHNHIKYIYIINEFSMAIDEDKLPLDKIYQNQEVTIYQTKL
ncbi:MAG: Uncharacterized protein G01um10147_69 [Microgenomates group bacterium Gr01-1014_7]|nr:MAG: Uncharacterized protein G01um10147_69 [Microgenomates group bacterium Gr01-1014_7]